MSASVCLHGGQTEGQKCTMCTQRSFNHHRSVNEKKNVLRSIHSDDGVELNLLLLRWTIHGVGERFKFCERVKCSLGVKTQNKAGYFIFFSVFN